MVQDKPSAQFLGLKLILAGPIIIRKSDMYFKMCLVMSILETVTWPD